MISELWGLATLLPNLAIGARRLHDTDRSGFWLFLILLTADRLDRADRLVVLQRYKRTTNTAPIRGGLTSQGMQIRVEAVGATADLRKIERMA